MFISAEGLTLDELTLILCIVVGIKKNQCYLDYKLFIFITTVVPT